MGLVVLCHILYEENTNICFETSCTNADLHLFILYSTLCVCVLYNVSQTLTLLTSDYLELHGKVRGE